MRPIYGGSVYGVGSREDLNPPKPKQYTTPGERRRRLMGKFLIAGIGFCATAAIFNKIGRDTQAKIDQNAYNNWTTRNMVGPFDVNKDSLYLRVEKDQFLDFVKPNY